MIPQITKALTSGFTSKQIIDYILKKFPDHSDKIKSALAAGFTAEQILKFLSGGRKALAQSEPTGTEFEQTRSKDIQRRENVAQGALALGTLAGTSLGAPIAQAAIQRVLPNSLKTLIPNISQQMAGATFPASTESQQPPISGNQSNTIAQPSQPEGIITNPSEILSKHNIKDKVDNIIKAGNGPTQVSAYFEKFDPNQKKTIEKETGQPFEKVIEEYAKTAAKQPEIEAANELPKPIESIEEPEITTELEKKQQPISKGATVATPNGIGEVKSIKEKNALVEVNGKLEKVPIEELEEEPQDVIETVQQLLKIPEVDRSSIVSLFTYDPDENKMYIQFHNGETYKYLDVDPEKVYKIANKMGIPITKGQNIFGAWSPEDKKSLGATLIKEIINDPKYKKPKKGEAANPNYVKLDTLYDYWEKLRRKSKKKSI